MPMAPAETSLLGIPGPLLHGAMIAVALTAFLYILRRRLAPLRAAAPDPRLDRIGARLRALLVVGFGQSRQPRYLVAGTLHIVIFFGFLILSLRSLTLLGEGFRAGFTLPLLGGAAGDVYATAKDVTALLVLVACAIAAVRRAAFHPARYHDRHAVASHGHEAYVILGLIGLLMVADAAYEGSALAATAGSGEHPFLPLATATALLLGGTGEAGLRTLHLGSFWVHNAALLLFLCYLPVSKHFHVITSLPNVFLANLSPGGAIKPPRHDVDDIDDLETLGVGRLEAFTWKHVLDFYTCTDCGRCSDVCPAYATGTPLSPRMISIKSRDLTYSAYPLLGAVVPEAERPNLVGEVIEAPELWACTTCRACEDACPILIEYVDKIVDMRRFLVEEGEVPADLQKPLSDLERQGNPYGKMSRQRGDWIDANGDGGCGTRILEAGDAAEALFFTDSAGAYDPRIQQVSRAFARLLEAGGVDTGTLGEAEVDSGHEARRMGEEGLFDWLREQNVEALEECRFHHVVTCDPHAMNALRHDYRLEQPVQHHTEALAELVAAGKLRPGPLDDDRTYTFHDPCYLGRHNDVYEPPRELLAAIPGLATVEMERSRNRSFCCGGGSLNLFYEGESETRMGEERVAMAEAAGARVIVTACPFCLINLEDAVKTTGREDSMEIVDIAELVERACAGQPTRDDPAPTSDGGATGRGDLHGTR